jgi:hypothetical protein
MKAAVTETWLETADPAAESAATSMEAADASTATTKAAMASAANAAERHSGIRGKHLERGHGANKAVIRFTERAHIHCHFHCHSLRIGRSLAPFSGCDTRENLERALQARLDFAQHFAAPRVGVGKSPVAPAAECKMQDNPCVN